MLIEQLWTYVRARMGQEQGQTLAEYALILVLISIAAVAVMGPLGTEISNAFTDVKNEL
jgi:Flp pilus assembly pilin Flp